MHGFHKSLYGFVELSYQFAESSCQCSHAPLVLVDRHQREPASDFGTEMLARVAAFRCQSTMPFRRPERDRTSDIRISTRVDNLDAEPIRIVDVDSRVIPKLAYRQPLVPKFSASPLRSKCSTPKQKWVSTPGWLEPCPRLR